MSDGFSVDATDMIRDLERMDDKVQRKYSRRAVAAGGRVLNKAHKGEVPVGPTGNLKRSHGVKTKVYRSSNTAVAVVGPRISGKRLGYHGHLVHNGHIARDGSFVPGNPYMQRANESAGGTSFAAMQNRLASDLEKGTNG